jgi:uracil-DNA glycosylase family protein
MAPRRPAPDELARPPRSRSLSVVREAAAGCTACKLYERATQTVFGAGAAHPFIMLVGEQPGDREDRQGLPFVGPAGAKLDEALAQAGIDPTDVYKTNAVKHFKWRPTSGKRRLHDRPDRNEIEICNPWLMKEIQLLGPEVIVALGNTAAVSLLGKNTPIAANRGRAFVTELAPVFLTYHPSSILRQREAEDRELRLAEIVEDLARARDFVTDSKRARAQ